MSGGSVAFPKLRPPPAFASQKYVGVCRVPHCELGEVLMVPSRVSGGVRASHPQQHDLFSCCVRLCAACMCAAHAAP